ncbi:MAG TPA: trypsin-like peptidase domain-containing protein [Puia sp.]|jgi:serine protease Do|nr:trypsin-like peptidase domain-containing protein [Puia sp.]
MKYILTILVSFLAVLGLLLSRHDPVNYSVRKTPVYQTRFVGDAGPVDFTVVARAAVPATVRVTAKLRNEGGQPARSSGSGAILSADGYIVTNYHVVKGSEVVTVMLDNHRTYKAGLVGTDASADIAVLKVDAQGLPFLSYGHSNELKVGQWVLAIGYPLGLGTTVTAGIVSAKGDSFIQTDAAVNLGSSGGPLIDRAGRLVGINGAFTTSTGAYVGYSFAIPADTVQRVVNRIIGGGGRSLVRR